MASFAATAKASAFLSGAQLRSAPRPSAGRAHRAAARPVTAKYGNESQFFDLDDLENTVGSWEMYGVEDSKRYPDIQSEFFERAAGPLTRRESVFSFLALAFTGGVLIWGGKGSKDAKLPITRGPQKPAVVGPRGRI